MRSQNTVLRKAAEECQSTTYGYVSATYSGVGLKTLYFLGMTILGGILGIVLMYYNSELFLAYLAISGIMGFISAIIAMRKPNLSFGFGTAYCIGEGMLIGVLSLLANQAFGNGIVLSAVAATVAVVLSCGLLYITGVIKVNSTFHKFLFILAVSFIISLLFISILSAFGVTSFDSFGMNILISAISVLIASLFLINDFNFAATIVENNGPKELEWMIAFGISYTIIWLYYEILTIIIRIAARNR